MFGMINTSHHPALGIVQHKNQAHTAPGTIVHSNEWADYYRVQCLPNVASVTFVDPTRGVHTESYWERINKENERMPCYLTI